VQTIIPLPAHGAMRLTTARYYTPSGRSIQALGIEPDITVEQAKLEVLEPSRRFGEANLRGALENPDAPNGATTPPPPENTTTPPADGESAVPPANGTGGAGTAAPGTAGAEQPQDYQLARALDLLHGIALYRTSQLN
jgi:carboxyl-terminal processing protease